MIDIKKHGYKNKNDICNFECSCGCIFEADSQSYVVTKVDIPIKPSCLGHVKEKYAMISCPDCGKQIKSLIKREIYVNKRYCGQYMTSDPRETVEYY